MAEKKTLNYYKKLLPKKITIEIHKAKEGGFWAKIKEFPYCYTQAENFLELVEMVNDAIFTHLEIPIRFKEKVGYYLPKEVIKALKEITKDEINRRKWERFVNELLSKEPLRERTQVFARP